MFSKISILIRMLLMNPEDYARYLGVNLGRGGRIYIRRWGSEPFLITVGDRVTITSGVRILTHDGATWLVRNKDGVRRQRYRPVIIGDDVFIGTNTIIMPGVTIGSLVIVGAGSVVTVDLPGNSVWAGNPARFICTFDEYFKKIEAVAPLDSDLPKGVSNEVRVRHAIQLSSEHQ